jgi:preprotein translocase subunit SecD
MKKALVAAVLVVLCAAGCKTHTHNVNNAKPVPIGIHEVVSCIAVNSTLVIDPRTSQKLCIDSKAIVTETNIRQAQAGYSSSTNEPVVNLYLDRSGAARMYEATQRITARRDNGRMAIFIDGNFLTAPVVREPLKDSLIISGNFTKRSAEDLADALMAGRERD